MFFNNRCSVFERNILIHTRLQFQSLQSAIALFEEVNLHLRLFNSSAFLLQHNYLVLFGNLRCVHWIGLSSLCRHSCFGKRRSTNPKLRSTTRMIAPGRSWSRYFSAVDTFFVPSVPAFGDCFCHKFFVTNFTIILLQLHICHEVHLLLLMLLYNWLSLIL